MPDFRPVIASRKGHLPYLIGSAMVTAGVFLYLLSSVSLSDVIRFIKETDRHALLLFIGCSPRRLPRYIFCRGPSSRWPNVRGSHPLLRTDAAARRSSSGN